MLRSTSGLQRLARLAAQRAQQQQQQQLLQQQQGQPQAARALASAAMPAAADSSDAPPVNAIDGKVMHPSLLNRNLLKTQYAVRGELYLRAEQLRKAGKEIIVSGKRSPFLIRVGPPLAPRPAHPQPRPFH
jgi:hypothetical protein